MMGNAGRDPLFWSTLAIAEQDFLPNPDPNQRGGVGAPRGVLKSSARITGHYAPESLVGRQVVAVVNFPPKQIGPLRSQCLVTGFHDANGEVVLAVPDGPVPNGTRLA